MRPLRSHGQSRTVRGTEVEVVYSRVIVMVALKCRIKISFCSCSVCVSNCLGEVIVCLLSLHGSGAGIVPRRVVGFNSFRQRRSVPAKREGRETSAESWSVRSSSMN